MSATRLIPGRNIDVINIDGSTNVLDVDLVDDNTSEENKNKIRTFTKKWVDIILTVSLIDIQLVFVLAYLGKEQIAETLGVAIVTEIIGVTISYLCKSYFESFSQAKNKIELERMKHEYNIQPHSSISYEETDSDDVVGWNHSFIGKNLLYIVFFEKIKYYILYTTGGFYG